MNVRSHLFGRRTATDPHFRWRGGEVSRIEGLSDAIFAFALTLLVVSLEVPRDFDELQRVLRGFPVFAICFALTVMVWWYHYRFFRRYGLEDFLTVVLNLALLFAVLFYVYPLRFLFGFLLNPLVGLERGEMAQGEVRWLMLFYSGGMIVVFGLFAALLFNALRQREALELDELELFHTWTSIGAHAIMIGLGLASCAIALAGESYAPYAGLIYFATGPLEGVWGWRRGARADALYRRLTSEPG